MYMYVYIYMREKEIYENEHFMSTVFDCQFFLLLQIKINMKDSFVPKPIQS